MQKNQKVTSFSKRVTRISCLWHELTNCLHLLIVRKCDFFNDFMAENVIKHNETT